MSNISISPDPLYSINGYDFDLEQLADAMTRDVWPDNAKMSIVTYADGTTRALSPKESVIDAMFGGVANDDGDMKLRLALTRYFLHSGRQLLPEMVELLIAGITSHLKDGKPWGRPNRKRQTDPEHLMAVLAIDNKFRGKRPEIGAELGITSNGVKDIIKRAKEANYPSLLYLFEDYMPSHFEDAVKILDPEYRDQFIRVNGIKLNRQQNLSKETSQNLE